MAITSLNREARYVQNPGLGASLIWRFTCGYTKNNATSDSPPLPLAFLVLPVLFHQDTMDVLAGTRAGLQAFADKFSQPDNQKSDILLDIHSRALRYRPLTTESLRIAIAAKLVTLLPAAGKLTMLTSANPSGVPASVRPMFVNAEKFGSWCAELTLYEVSTTLKVSF